AEHGHGQADDQRYPGTVNDAAVDVAAEGVGAEAMHERHLLAVFGAYRALRARLLVAVDGVDLGWVDGAEDRRQRPNQREEGHDGGADDDARVAHHGAEPAGPARGGRAFGDLGRQNLDAQ